MTTPIPLGLSDDQLDSLLTEPMLAYDPSAVDALLDDIARLQGPERDAAITGAIAATPAWTLPSHLLAKTEGHS